ncbi:CAP domain-containing protein [Candidatus Parcubacteria bacterium]|nr:MAG: CAP domain-containing protein [Candidatus Parcubacteria bacterium]
MRKWLKKYFIPHKENDHQPHILRYEATIAVLSFTLLIEILFLYTTLYIFPGTNFLSAILPDALVRQTNETRETANLSSLKTNPLLEQAAKLKAEDMASRGYFSHNTPDGLTPWHWLEVVGYRFGAAGENLAVNFIDSADVTKAWIDSPSHRANILNNGFTEIGIATAKGNYNGRETIFVVQFLGRPSSLLASLPQAFAQEKEPAINESETFVLTEEPQEPIVAAQSLEQKNLPEITLAVVEKAATSPRATTNLAFLTLATIIFLALALKIFIKIEIQYPRLITNGVIMLIIIASALLINHYLAVSQIIVL